MACMMGRPIWELRETMPADEWDRWITFFRLYDLPDGYFVAAVLSTQIAAAMGAKHPAWSDAVPYFKPHVEPPPEPAKPRPQMAIPGPSESIAAAFAFLRANPDVSKPKQ
jgi:hypothetical protein